MPLKKTKPSTSNRINQTQCETLLMPLMNGVLIEGQVCFGGISF